MTNPVDAAIAKAEQATAALAPTGTAVANANVVDMVPSNNGSYAAPAPVTFADLKKGMSVDTFLKFAYYGMSIGDPEPLFQGPIKAKIDMKSDFVPFEAACYGQPPVYIKTFDRVVEENGGSWADALNKARRASPSLRTYAGINISATITEDVQVEGKTVKGGAAGTRVGYSTPFSAAKNMSKFHDEVVKLNLADSVVDVLISYEKRTNKENQKWGGIILTLVGPSAA